MNEMAAPTSEASEPGAETFLELSRRAAMLGAVGYAATLLIGGTDWRAGVEELLRRMGLATGASRASLFEVHRVADGRMVQSCRFDWAEPPLRPISDDPRYAEMSLGDEEGEIGDWTLRRMRGEVVQALRSEVSGYTRQVYEEQGTLSGPVTRSPDPITDFVDANNVKWDVKGFVSETPGARGAFDLETAVEKITSEVARGNNVILDTSRLSPGHLSELRGAVEGVAEWSGKIVWFP